MRIGTSLFSVLCLGNVVSCSVLSSLRIRALDYWKPQPSLKWQIVLQESLGSLNISGVDVYDVDLNTTSKAQITTLQANGKKVICYFSAGSWEKYRPDQSLSDPRDIGNKIAKGETSQDGYWPGEKWLNIRSPGVLGIMFSRIQQAADKGCDAVDPDNVDGYGIDQSGPNDNGFNPKTGFNITQADCIVYLTRLATEAHSRGLAIGLKNAIEIVPQIEPLVDFAVNEQCVQYKECSTPANLSSIRNLSFILNTQQNCRPFRRPLSTKAVLLEWSRHSRQSSKTGT
ncbi:(Trans)glycosidase [Glarea lozoyensis ATCC 20868]|uniref:alpha-galactosidase n=1 Tax=Glarea lozoyensis (strain ATCC 20868 / MF5171) TaxID=1116229 RepID=S3CE28_GLAL2|nr:(Trans)glycosidase [Glarea lozoyensis ATCC 20868]EPE24260.1 (Trans)glycosidase [Glarea lozoyensis ATCC 20868]